MGAGLGVNMQFMFSDCILIITRFFIIAIGTNVSNNFL